MNIIMIRLRLYMLLFVVVCQRIENSSQNLDSDKELLDQCTIHASEYDQTTMETDEGKYNSKGRIILSQIFSKSYGLRQQIEKTLLVLYLS